MAVLHVLCVGASGMLTHTIRRIDGSWLPFGDVRSVVLGANPGSPDPVAFEDVACAGVGNDLQLCGLTRGGGVVHTIRALDGSWPFGFGDLLAAAAAPRGSVFSVGAAGLPDQFRACAAIKTTTGSIVSTDQALYETARNSAGSWSPFANRGGSFSDVSFAQAGGMLHFCGITFDHAGVASNMLNHALKSGSTWTPFGDVRSVVLAENPGSFDPGLFHLVSCAGIDGELHICAISSGRLFHTIRRANGTFSPFGDVVTAVVGGNPGSPSPSGLGSVSCAGVNGELHILCVDAAGALWHTIRRADGTFFPFGDVKDVILGVHPGSLDPGQIATVAVADSF
jgi:hypothetical protein